MLLSPSSWPRYRMVAPFDQESLPQSIGDVWSPLTLSNPAQEVTIRQSSQTSANIGLVEAPVNAHVSSSHDIAASMDNEYLLDSFLQNFMPPILATVEIGPKLATTRSLFASMSAKSSMVRLAVMAFSAFQLSRSQSGKYIEYQPFYDRASQELRTALATGTSAGIRRNELEYFLATIFLLTCADLLTEKLPQAHGNLKEAFHLIHSSGNDPFTAAETRLISWIRLLDARAVSTAGGEGLFLTDDDATLIASSPVPTQVDPSAGLDTEIEEILFDVLYHPGLIFYQKVQSFVGRIANIDPWHRSRGTVSDETEVMAIAASISSDLHSLYGQRPTLMDHAVAGNLTEKHLAKNLAPAITRSFRTYLANYYASLIHLHRVAYKSFPRTNDVQNAIANIKRLSHLMEESDESLPVNLLWPLLMWGAEEDNPEDRQWILKAIRGLETVATNAKFTADLLEEVQHRQDGTHQRVDIRGVSQDFAVSHFAII
ncbi:hypothetical protein CNMCM5793_004678 [Aspergillus hiratsukae]|uniref:C6 finger domain protein n=1 Tax=Aspergillus hiratsukae TaxID=1194566 RepID=A0A8H6PFL5_9EURO|nr:hypothetical protein CNMCM5793_004678 [Aspergillus hiratsukae]